MKLNIPIALTLFRIILIPFLLVAFYLPVSFSNFLTALLFLIAALTDWFDGYLARKWKQTTRFGAFLDPVADKIMVAIVLILITEYYHTWWISIPAMIMIAREIIISALREWMAEIGKRNHVAVSILGKIKTVAQMTSLTLLLWQPNMQIEMLGFICLYIAVILTLWSMYQYLLASRTDFMENSE